MQNVLSKAERRASLLELPAYREPRWKNLLQTMVNKGKVFVTEAGKIIMVVSLLLWALSSYGPKKRMAEIRKAYEKNIALNNIKSDSLEAEYNKLKLENSYAGLFGKAIEPALQPLGYDWKIGISIVTSFAAREVFIGTMATLYSVGADNEDLRLRDKMKQAKRSNGAPTFTLATGISLLIFYALAMQCISTLAVARRETKSWKYPAIMFLYMTGIAYVVSFVAYQLLK